MDIRYTILANPAPYLYRYNFTDIGIVITTDTFTSGYTDRPAGNTGAIANGKLLSVSPTNIGDIQLSVEEFGFFLSRSYTGTPCNIDIEIAGQLPLRMLTGIVGSIRTSGTAIGIEIVADLEKLSTDTSIFTSQANCMWSIGVGRCTADRQEQEKVVIGVSGKNIVLDVPLSAPLSPDFSWECSIGKDTYIINAAASNLSTIVVDRAIIGKTRKIRIRRFCNRSYEQCGVYNNRHQFSGLPFLNTDSLNYVL
jgi:hypothetical protein